MDTQIELDVQTLTDEAAARRAEIAARVGVAPDRINAVRFQLGVLREQGILVDLTITGAGLFTRTATWMELGVPDEDIRRQRLTRGQKYMIPEKDAKEEMSIISAMRQLLEDYSYRITGFYPYRWIPFTAFDEFIEKWGALVERFYAVKARIIADYPKYVDLLASDFRQIAENAWRSVVKKHSKAAAGRKIVLVMDGQEYPDMESYVEAVVENAVGKLPTVEQIEAELHADWTPAMVYGEQDVAADQLAAERIQQEIQLERAKGQAKQQEAYIQAEILRSQAHHERTIQEMEEEKKRVKLEAMRKAADEQARKRLQQMKDPFDEVFNALRGRVADDCKKLLESVQKNGYVRGKVAEKGSGLLELYKLMAAHDDQELRDLLVQLKKAIGPVGKARGEDAPERDAEEIKATLSQIIDLSHSAASDLAAGPSRFSLVEV